MILAPVFIYVLPVVTLLAVAMLGTTRRLGFRWTLLASILLTPIGGFALALLSGPSKRKPSSRPRATVEKPAQSQAAQSQAAQSQQPVQSQPAQSDGEPAAAE